jgi:hypothetical protein
MEQMDAFKVLLPWSVVQISENEDSGTRLLFKPSVDVVADVDGFCGELDASGDGLCFDLLEQLLILLGPLTFGCAMYLCSLRVALDSLGFEVKADEVNPFSFDRARQDLRMPEVLM